MKPEIVLSSARKMISVPFFKYGRNEFGIDCVGLLFHVLKETGSDIKDRNDYSFPDRNESLVRVLKELKFKQYKKPKIGMIGCYSVHRPGKAAHAGIISDKGLIHVLTGPQGIGGCVETDDPFWHSRLVTCFGFPNIEYY